jgi:AraC-like DNA-binding protein
VACQTRRVAATGPETDAFSESVQSLPTPALRPWVAWYSGYRQVGAPGRHRGLPSPYLTFILTLDEPLLVVSHPDPAQLAGRYDSLVGGLHTSAALIVHDGRQSGIQLALHPVGARVLLGCPAGAFAGHDLPADDLLGADADRLRERICSGVTWAERFAALDDGLIELIGRREASAPHPNVAGAWELMLRTGGRLTVEEVSRQTGWGARQLRIRLQSETGLGTKAAMRVIRFDRARRLLARDVRSGRGTDLAGLAAECGYFDQAHLTREFDMLVGCPPGRWVAEEVRNIQSGAHEPVSP